MIYNPDTHHRHSIRLKDYDYSQAGAYFITICAQNRECLFGEIANGKMWLNNAGQMVEKWYYELANKYPDIQCQEHIVMPNHFHCIIHNVGADLRVCPNNARQSHNTVHIHNAGQLHNIMGQSHRIAPTDIQKSDEHTMGEQIGSPLRNVVQWFKTMTTNEYIRHVKQNGWRPFKGKLWQRNYYEHIIRNEKELNEVREYILTNPLKWDLDDENPSR